MKPIYSNYSPTFLYVDKYRFPREWINDAHQIPYSMVRYICSGKAKFVVDGKAYIVEQEDVFYIPQGAHLHCSRKLCSSVSGLLVPFSCRVTIC